MAFRTGGGKLTAGLVYVTTCTFPAQSHKCAVWIDLVQGQPSCVGNKPLCVTTAAVDADMFTIQSQAGKRMIETLLSGLPIDKSNITPLVLNVAGLTLSISLAAMQSGVSIKTSFDKLMAGETLFSDQLTISAMALAAVLHTFEKGVRAVQFARRNLR
jgi:hypothetical protein